MATQTSAVKLEYRRKLLKHKVLDLTPNRD